VKWIILGGKKGQILVFLPTVLSTIKKKFGLINISELQEEQYFKIMCYFVSN
jgi:hypothetical protein